jgi:hypothetical protein
MLEVVVHPDRRAQFRFVVVFLDTSVELVLNFNAPLLLISKFCHNAVKVLLNDFPLPYYLKTGDFLSLCFVQFPTPSFLSTPPLP